MKDFTVKVYKELHDRYNEPFFETEYDDAIFLVLELEIGCTIEQFELLKKFCKKTFTYTFDEIDKLIVVYGDLASLIYAFT